MGYTKTYKDGSTPSVCIIGAGFSGICAAIRLKTELNLTSYEIFELEPELGGTWFSNTYPGIGCDVKSHNYAFSFEPNYDWSKAYAGGKEIWEYLRRVVDKHGLYEKIQFKTKIVHTEWRADIQKWRVKIEEMWAGGEVVEKDFDLVFAGMGPLRIPRIPEEFQNFDGPKWHTAQWNHDFDLTDKRVAIVGSGARPKTLHVKRMEIQATNELLNKTNTETIHQNGSCGAPPHCTALKLNSLLFSAIQVVPSIVNKVKSLDFYQRSATYVIPRNNGKYNAAWKFLFRNVPLFHRVYYNYLYYSSEFTLQLFSSKWQHKLVRNSVVFGAWLVRLVQIRDKKLREKLTPHYEMGCRRVVVSSDYYPALMRSHVHVHTEGIQSVKGDTITLKDGTTQQVDAMVLATGFLVQKPVPEGFMKGTDGCDVGKIWDQNPQTYYGLTSVETPNMFFLLGPNTTLGHNSVLFMIEAQVDHAIKAISYMMKNDLSSIQATKSACDDFMTEVHKKMEGMVWSGNCQSWYQNDQGRVTALWWSSCGKYASRLNKFKPEHFVKVEKTKIQAL
ncbi:hypothetical protein BG004_004406 [Podila humilis]|nr:hypothetical protein BG004_004406 [Podila humilis]